MGTRKRWRVVLLPSWRRRSAPSQRKAYEHVAYHREIYAVGMSNVHHVDVEVDEGDGWRLFESIEFPERAG